MANRTALPAPPGASKHTVSPLDRLLESLDESLQNSCSPLRCISCGNPVTTREECFSIDGQTDFHFVNPGGYQFDIRVYRNALGCYPKGDASDEQSWFPPYRWQYALCDQCDLHIGWFYKDEDGDTFWGLITALLTNS